MQAHRALISAETLAAELELVAADALPDGPAVTGPVQVGDAEQVRIRVTS